MSYLPWETNHKRHCRRLKGVRRHIYRRRGHNPHHMPNDRDRWYYKYGARVGEMYTFELEETY